MCSRPIPFQSFIMSRRSRRRFGRRNPVFRQPSIIEVAWQGAPLAFEQLEDLLERIRHALQPPRADIIDKAVRTALRVVDLLEDFWESMPPGTTPFVRATERRALSGWPPAVSPQTREEFEDEDEEDERHRRRREHREDRRERRRERRAERREDRRDRDDDDDWEDDWDDDWHDDRDWDDDWD